MEVSKISALVRLVQRAVKLAARIMAEAEEIGIEPVKRRRRRKKVEEGKGKVAKKAKTRPGPAKAREEETED